MEPDQIITTVIAKLEYLRDVPVDELETGLDEVNLKMVDLRDRLIERCRSEQCAQEAAGYLRQVNIAISLIFGLAYPVTGFQRRKIEQAVGVLKPLAGAHA